MTGSHPHKDHHVDEPIIKVAETPIVPIPTTEQLVDLEREIHRLVERKRRVDQHIVDIEARIHSVETDFLRETAQFGPLFHGLEGYLGHTNPSGLRRAATRDIRDSDRLFSNTSSSYHREQMLGPIPSAQQHNRRSSNAIPTTPGSTSSSTQPRNRKRPVDPDWSTPIVKSSRSR